MKAKILVIGILIVLVGASVGIVTAAPNKAMNAQEKRVLETRPLDVPDSRTLEGTGSSSSGVGQLGGSRLITPSNNNVNQPLRVVTPSRVGMPSSITGGQSGPLVEETPVADANGDGVVNPLDIGFVLDRFGPATDDNRSADLDNDGVVDMNDIKMILDFMQP